MVSSSEKPASRRARNITIVLRRRALALLTFLAAGVAATARGEDATEPKGSGAPKFRFEAVLHDYEPVSDRHERFAEFFYGALAADWTRGDFAAKAEVRGRDGLFRPYYDGSVWLEEGWASVATPIGAVSVGKIPRDFGLADETFIGTLFTVNGVTRNPDWGAGLTGERRLGYDTLGWSARYYGQNDHVSWEDDGRSVESDSARVLRDGLEARVFYLLNKGLWTLKPGLSFASARLDERDGPASFRRTDAALDVTATFGPFALLLEGFTRSGERCAPGARVPARLRRRDGGSRGISRGISHRHVSLSLFGVAVSRGRRHRAASSARGRLDAAEGPSRDDRVQCAADDDEFGHRGREGFPARPLGGVLRSAAVNAFPQFASHAFSRSS